MTVAPAMVTPFDERGQVDGPSVARLLAHFRAEGCDKVVLSGTNGEGPSLSAVEKRDLVRLAVPLADSMGVILGIATASLEEAVWLSQQAGKAGAEAVLVMPPAYFREATEAGIVAWYASLMDRSPIPVLLYNFPKRTGIPITSEIVGRLVDHPRMAGLKDSSGEVANLATFAAAASGKALYVGDETLLLDSLAHGWQGTISGAANVVARWLVAVGRDLETAPESAQTKFAYIQPALKALRKAPQPVTNKVILSRRGILARPDVRLPLTANDPAGSELIDAAVAETERLMTRAGYIASKSH